MCERDRACARDAEREQERERTKARDEERDLLEEEERDVNFELSETGLRRGLALSVL